ncbi:MAG: zinc ribbon domain-containing protein [Gammaproteobacteria bacterium SHHR-1]|uniref:FmdB family zinc ribbon protein n=1 Tax=Magnetovirga frankeli TaxID=947516 RepID=UPI0012940B2A|nr:zinc ribbon domain-containing protein [gamma proteobacterium SS-5]
MPFYDYRCEACGHALEVLQKISDPLLTDCPECGQPTLKKQLTAPVFRLKGGGWYETDFKSGNKKNLHDSGKEDKPKADKADKVDKPADKAKPEAKSAKKEPAPAAAAS